MIRKLDWCDGGGKEGRRGKGKEGRRGGILLCNGLIFYLNFAMFKLLFVKTRNLGHCMNLFIAPVVGWWPLATC